ncbi:MAG: motility protein A [Rhodospirillales bacterium]|jgi:chemotaxis protein MotA
MANDESIEIKKVKGSLDLATILGLVSVFGLVALAIYLGGDVKSFFNPPSILIVVGGTLAIVTVCYSISEVARTGRIVLKTLTQNIRDPSEAAMQVLQFSDLARKKGVLSLQEVLSSIRSEPFFHKGVMMVLDGTPGAEVELIMQRDMQATGQRHVKSTSILRKAAEFAPAMGLIGTLIGLVQMLGNLKDPSTIGPAMAVALLTTFYGAVLANMVFLPLASKLERNSVEEMLIYNLYTMGATSIGRQENPRRLEMLLNSVLPPAKRVQYFD